MEAKPVELMFLPSPATTSLPAPHQPTTATTSALLRLLASNEPLGEQLAPKPLFLPRPCLPEMAGHRAVHASVFS
jgi:hypothetical protein